MSYAAPKGVFDILPSEPLEENRWRNSDHWQYIEQVIRKTADLYGFKEIRTPLFEATELFVRSAGEISDIVSKEMYTFLDKGERSLSLRPEGTAPTMRAFVENKLHTQQGPHKYYYIGPMFRYERPQKGRYRQHHQFGAEAIGAELPEQDVEIIDFLCAVYTRLGIRDLTVTLNSVGDVESRTAYKAALENYLSPHFEHLSQDSQTRFSKNILRILDSKDPKDQAILEQAPSILDFLNLTSETHFNKVRELLNGLHIPYTINPKLVRGLDYYNNTVFEILSGELGAHNTIGAGGRYDGLIASLGGPNLPAVGFGTGLERLLQIMHKQQTPFPPPPHPLLFLIPLGEVAAKTCFEWMHALRKAHLPVTMDMSGKKISHAFQVATGLGAEYALVIGEEELKQQKGKLKKLDTREETPINLNDLTHVLQTIAKSDKL